MDVYYMDISGRRTMIHCNRLDFRLRGIWVDEDNMFIKYENIIKVVCYDKKTEVKNEREVPINGKDSKRTKAKWLLL